MSGFYLIVKAKKETPTVNNSRILTYFDNPIEFKSNKQYEMALVSLDTVHSYTNICSKNNVFRYSPNSGTSYYTIYIEEGAYELSELNEYLQTEMQKQVGSLYRTDGVVIGANLTTLRSTLKFGKPGPTTHYYVDFNVSNSLAPILGFNKQEYTYVEKREDPVDPDKVTSFIDYYESESIVKIDDVSIIRVTNDIIGSSYSDGKSTNDIYSFHPDVPPGYKVSEKPFHLIYLPIVVGRISRMETNILNQNGNLIDFRGEDIIVRFHVRERINSVLQDLFTSSAVDR